MLRGSRVAKVRDSTACAPQVNDLATVGEQNSVKRRTLTHTARGMPLEGPASPGRRMPEHDDEDLILERLREATSGESTARQLRRRYDLLRRDYEVLIDRLAELEERFEEAPAPAAREATPAAPAVPVATPPAGLAAELVERMMQPLLALHAEYTEALAAMQGLVGGLETVTHGAMKGQRGSSPPPPDPEPERIGGTPAPEPARVNIDVHARGFGDLLDFQERLAAVRGVARVSISAIDSERAAFVVELDD